MVHGQELTLISGQQQQQLQYQGMANATKRRISQKGPAAGPAPSDRALQGGGQAVSTGRGGKKQLTIRAQGNGSGKGHAFAGSHGPEHRQQQHLFVGNRDVAEPSASGQPTQDASSTGGGRLDSLRAAEEGHAGKRKGGARRDRSGNIGRGEQERKPGEAPGEQESKYGKDFKIPELPPLLQAQLFGPGGQAEGRQSQPRAAPGGMGASIGGHKPYKIKRFIDEMYQKEAKSRYHRQYVREDFLLTQSPIFDLGKYHQLRPQGELMPRGGRNRFGGLDSEVAALGLDKKGNPVFPSESQSLTNVMGFQAGGVSLLAPGNMKTNPELQFQMAQLNSHSDLPSLVGQHLEPPNAIWNRINMPPQLGGGRSDEATPRHLTNPVDALAAANAKGLGPAPDDGEADDALLRTAAPLLGAAGNAADSGDQ